MFTSKDGVTEFIKNNYEDFVEWYKEDKMNLFLIKDFERYEQKKKRKAEEKIEMKKYELIEKSLIPDVLKNTLI